MAKKSTRARAARKSPRSPAARTSSRPAAKKSKRVSATRKSKRPSATKRKSTRASAVEPPGRGLIVTLSGDRGIADVSRDLRRAGLTIDQVLEPTGIVTGKADPASAEKLRQVKGVADVSPDHPVRIGPPDSDVQ